MGLFPAGTVCWGIDGLFVLFHRPLHGSNSPCLVQCALLINTLLQRLVVHHFPELGLNKLLSLLLIQLGEEGVVPPYDLVDDRLEVVLVLGFRS